MERLRLIGEHEEGVQSADAPGASESRVAIHLCTRDTPLLQRGDPRMRVLEQLGEGPESNGFRRAGGGAGGLQSAPKPVVTQGALSGSAIAEMSELGYPEWAGGDAIPTTVAHILLNVDRVELGADDRPGGAGFHAARVDAVLADVAEHQPGDGVIHVDGGPLNEGDMPPGRVTQVEGVVVTLPGECSVTVGGKVVPLLARDFTCLAADAETGVRQEPVGVRSVHRHGVSPPIGSAFRTSQVSAFASWMKELGSSTKGVRSLAIAPCAIPPYP